MPIGCSSEPVSGMHDWGIPRSRVGLTQNANWVLWRARIRHSRLGHPSLARRANPKWQLGALASLAQFDMRHDVFAIALGGNDRHAGAGLGDFLLVSPTRERGKPGSGMHD